MGYYIFDKFSLLHFSVGVLWNYYGLDLVSLIVLHIIFEAFENTSVGMAFINKYFKLWPGGKEHADSLLNSLSDTFFSALGWIFYQNHSKNIDKTAILALFVGNVMYYWLIKNLYIGLILGIFLVIAFWKEWKYYLYYLVGIGLGYAVTLVDNEFRLFM